MPLDLAKKKNNDSMRYNKLIQVMYLCESRNMFGAVLGTSPAQTVLPNMHVQQGFGGEWIVIPTVFSEMVDSQT